MRKQKGITLIALIITIIVLLILAGISIATLTGENGILTQANKAKEETIIAREKEGISIAFTDFISRIITAETDEEYYEIAENLEGIMREDGNDVSVGLEEFEDIGQEVYNITYNDTGHIYIAYFDYGDWQMKVQNKEILKDIFNGVVTENGEIILEKNNGEVLKIYGLSKNEGISEVYGFPMTITKSGIKQVSGEYMIDRDGKLYDLSKERCLTDKEGSALAGKKVTKISADENSVIAIDEEGKLYSYGDNYSGQLGNGTTEDSYMPICISDITNSPLNGKNIVDVYYDDSFVIVKDNEGKLYSWGRNYSGELGNGTTEDSYMPICISDITNSPLNGKNIVDVYRDGYTVIAKDSEGKLYTWGANYSGKLGNGTTENSSMPICISDIQDSPLNGKNIVDVYIYGGTVIAKDREGKLYTWGYNRYGELGNGTTENSYMPVCISDITNSPLNGKNIVDVYVDVYIGGSIVIAKDSEGKLYTWGENYCGKLGNGTTEDSYMPVCISDIQDSPLNGKNIVDVYTGGSIVIAKDSEGKLYTWGENREGNLGNGTTENSYMPVCISDIQDSPLNGKNIVDAYRGSTYAVVAMDSEGKLYSWGGNYGGELGNGTTENSSMPICITDIKDSKIYNKKIEKHSKNNNALLYIMDSGEVYYHYLGRGPQ